MNEPGFDVYTRQVDVKAPGLCTIEQTSFLVFDKQGEVVFLLHSTELRWVFSENLQICPLAFAELDDVNIRLKFKG